MYIYVSVKLPLAHVLFILCYHGLRRMLKVLLTTVKLLLLNILFSFAHQLYFPAIPHTILKP